ncbi:MAG: putative transporter ATP-binding protein [Clostridiales bacterium]|nr:putative transporter ATP-binding protein [Clostridiales bacterium]
MVIINNISKSYENNGSKTNYVLDNINLEIADNEFVCVLGKSGCGKSTLLNILAGYVKADKGKILVNGEEVIKPSKERGVVFQEHALFPWYTVIQNIAFGPVMNKKKNAYEIAENYLKAIKLEQYKDYYPDQLSGGMKQRVGVARAFANQPDILLMDEPFSALDNTTRNLMQNELLKIWETNKTTVVFITHSIEEAVTLADRVIVMGGGKVLANSIIDLKRERDPKSTKFSDYVTYFRDVIDKNDENNNLINHGKLQRKSKFGFLRKEAAI